MKGSVRTGMLACQILCTVVGRTVAESKVQACSHIDLHVCEPMLFQPLFPLTRSVLQKCVKDNSQAWKRVGKSFSTLRLKPLRW